MSGTNVWEEIGVPRKTLMPGFENTRQTHMPNKVSNPGCSSEIQMCNHFAICCYNTDMNLVRFLPFVCVCFDMCVCYCLF